MTIYQGSITILAHSYVGTAAVSYDTGGEIVWDIGGGVEYAISSQGSITPTIRVQLITQGSIQIVAHAYLSLNPIKIQISAIAQDYAPEDYLTLSQDEDGDWFATLDETYWSDLGQTSVYAGFRIVCGNGLAYINEDPQYHVTTVGVDIIAPFVSWRMYPTQWHLYIPLGTDFNTSVDTPNYFRRSDLLSAYMSDVRKYVVSESNYLTHRAGDLRKWDRMPADFLDQLLATLGCYLRLDQLDSEGRRRLAFEWIRFLLYAGDKLFVDFLGYVYDTHFDIEALWTNDYRDFISFSPDLDNSYYPTNHVSLIYDLNSWNIDDQDQLSLIIDTFYKLASVPIVLEALAGKRQENFSLYLVVADQSSHDTFSWSPYLVVASTTLYITAVDYRHIERESWSPLLQLNLTTLYIIAVDYRHIERSSYSPLLVVP
jgi:hypothetical protein